jgi:hypothetical protein
MVSSDGLNSTLLPSFNS